MNSNIYHIKNPTEILTTFLGIPKEYKQKLINEAYRLGDSMYQKTNVKAIMSSYAIWEQTNFFNTLLDVIKSSPLIFNPDPRYKLIIDSAWSAIYKKGHYTKSHSHSPSYISFVYYLKSTGETPLVFSNCDFELKPIDDMLVVFPGYVKHEVPIHKEDEDRICVAGNFMIIPNRD